MTTSERIDRLDYQLSQDIGVSVPALRAIRQVESGGNPRAVRFETRVFRNRTGQTVEGSNRAAFVRAYAINPTEAVNSTSWGWFQVMGFHGFPEMYGGHAQAVAAFDANPEAVSLALFKRWMNKPAARIAKEAAARLDFARFASVYNGCAMPCERYSTRMQAAYERAVSEWSGYVPSGGTSLFLTLVVGVAGGVGYYFYKRKKRTGSFFGSGLSYAKTAAPPPSVPTDEGGGGGGGEDCCDKAGAAVWVSQQPESEYGNRLLRDPKADCDSLSKAIEEIETDYWDFWSLRGECSHRDSFSGCDVSMNDLELAVARSKRRLDRWVKKSKDRGCTQIAGLR